MAAPASVTLRNLSGQYVMNKKLSSDIEPILVLVSTSLSTPSFRASPIHPASRTASPSSSFAASKPRSLSFPDPPTDLPLLQQSVSWLLRKTISISTLTLHLTQHVDHTTNTTHIDITQVGTGGFKGTQEHRVLNGEVREHEDYVFGKVRGRSRWVKRGEVEDAFLREGFLEEEDGELVNSWVESINNGWIAEQVWGFEVVEGERRHVRHVVVTKGRERREARLVYDYRPR